MTSNTSLAAQTVANLEPWLTITAALAWCAPLLLLVAPVWRLARRRGRTLDPLWAVLLLGVGNRLGSDFLGVPPALQHVSAVIIAVLLAMVVRSYQHGDA